MTPKLIIITLAAYIIVLLIIAWLSGRKARNADYFVANRSTRWYMAAMAMIAAAMSGITFVSVPGAVASDSFSYMQMTLGFTAGQLVIAFVLIPLFYRLRVVSLYQYLDQRFGVSSHKSGAWLFFISKVAIVALRLFVMCSVLQVLLFDYYDVPFALNIAITVLVLWCVTRWGGVKTLIWTDALKTLCLVGSLILSVIFISKALGWSCGEMVERVIESDMSRVFFFDDPSSPKYFWKMFLAGMFTLIAMTGLDQDMMQCNLSCVNSRDAQINIVITALSQLFVIMLFLVLGVLLYSYADFANMTLPQKPDQLFSLVAFDSGMPAALGVLFILGLTSSTLSSAASSLTALTTSLTIDLLGADKLGDEHRVTKVRLRSHTLLAVIVAVLILLVGSIGNESVINTMFKFVG